LFVVVASLFSPRFDPDWAQNRHLNKIRFHFGVVRQVMVGHGTSLTDVGKLPSSEAWSLNPSFDHA
jgi:hypothetical protein